MEAPDRGFQLAYRTFMTNYVGKQFNNGVIEQFVIYVKNIADGSAHILSANFLMCLSLLAFYNVI